jgi:tol-pal system-associated acyl-CoA thioesterase
MKPPFKCNDFICKIFVEDTDFQGIVYHANYLKYFERSRSQFLIDHQHSQTDALLNNESYVVKAINLEFFVPAKLEDTLIIRSNIVLASKARLQFFQSAVNQKNDTLICKGLVEVCYFDSIKNKPKAFPSSLLALFR